MAFQDIKRVSDGKSKMGAFILASCFIEHLAGFRYGKATTNTDYKAFVGAYLPGYNAVTWYKDLRCRLVHNCTEGGSYAFTYGRHDLHGKMLDGRTVINLEDFTGHLERAMLTLCAEMDGNSNIQALAKQRLKKIGVLGVWAALLNRPA